MVDAYRSETMLQGIVLGTKFGIVSLGGLSPYLSLLNPFIPNIRHCFQTEALSGYRDGEEKGGSISSW